jgi:UDP-2,3-diacylglucosamine pyrophosphatase LpxH
LNIWTAVAWGGALAYGFAFATLLYLVKESLLEPLGEALLEWWERRLPPDPVEEKLARPQERTWGETFIISDLHIDTWHRVPLIGGEPREQHFADFLGVIKRTALELYVNGDLLDMPPNPAEEWLGPGGVRLRQSLLPKYAFIFEELAEFNAGSLPTMTMYMTGNHDMAANGIRYLLHHLYDLLPGAKLPFQNVWYGNFIISLPYTCDPPNAPIRYFLEHGHYHDPVLVLYLLQFVANAVSSNLQAAMDSLTVGGQRRTSPKSSAPRPGIAGAGLPPGNDTFMHRLVKWRWRWKARRRLTGMNRQEIRMGHEPLAGILMGHTHLPDHYVYRLGSLRGKTYVNTGDWSGDTGHASYAVVTDDGLVYLYDWHTNPAPHHRSSAIA